MLQAGSLVSWESRSFRRRKTASVDERIVSPSRSKTALPLLPGAMHEVGPSSVHGLEHGKGVLRVEWLR